MLIDKKVTKKIAFLARIGLSEKEEEEFSKDLSNINKGIIVSCFDASARAGLSSNLRSFLNHRIHLSLMLFIRAKLKKSFKY